MIFSGVNSATLALRAFNSADAFALIAIPFFMLSGKLMEMGYVGANRTACQLSSRLDLPGIYRSIFYGTGITVVPKVRDQADRYIP